MTPAVAATTARERLVTLADVGGPVEELVLAVACGGTGGHFYPGLSIALEWQRQGGRAVLFLAGQHQAEQIAIAEREGLAAVPVPVTRWPRGKAQVPLFAARMLAATWRVRGRLRRLGARAVLCMGSFASVPVGAAAVTRRLPLVLHEGNAHLGRANRFLARAADAVALAWPLAVPQPTRPPQRVVGMPVRQALLDAAAEPPLDAFGRAMLCRELGLDPDLPTLLSFGGSQGAEFLNQQLAATLADFRPPRRFQLVHLCGRGNDPAPLTAACEAAGVLACIRPFEARMDRLYRLADCVLSRAGGSTLAELALFARGAILVPFPGAMEDHQWRNAQIAVAAGGAIAVRQEEASPETLRALLSDWLARPEEARARGAAMATLARPHAAAATVGLLAEAILARH